MTQETKDKLEALLREGASDGKISCEAAWQIASELSMDKQDVGSAAEDLGIRISSCQLGCF